MTFKKYYKNIKTVTFLKKIIINILKHTLTIFSSSVYTCFDRFLSNNIRALVRNTTLIYYSLYYTNDINTCMIKKYTVLDFQCTCLYYML